MEAIVSPYNGLNQSNITVSASILSNSSAPTENHPVLYAFAYVASLICISTIACNLVVILAFIREPTIRSAFSYYLLNVAVSDLGFAVFSMTGFIWFTLNPAANPAYCPYYNFLGNMFGSGIGHAALLISLDRLFAVYLPLRYRSFISVKFTVTICACTWLYLLILNGPYNLMDAMWYNENTLPCVIYFKEQYAYSLVMEFLVYDVPLWFVLASYVLVWFKLTSRAKVRHQGSSRGAPVVHRNADTDSGSSVPTETGSAGIPVVKPKDETKFHRLFALVALCTLVCFLPSSIYYLLVDFLPYWNENLYAIITCLQYLGCVLNPIIYHSSLPELRKAIKKILLC